MSAPFALPPKAQLEPSLRLARKHLEDSGADSAALDARILLTEATGLEYAAVLLAPSLDLNPAQAGAFEKLIERRAKGEPVARILGRKEFWGMEFRLNEATLVPRPDTETLIEAALAFLDARGLKDAPVRVADLGTGTGCILAALLSECPNAEGVGVDVAPKAVRQARENFERLGLGPRARALVSNWCDNMKGPFHLIVSNPPYIGKEEMAGLMVEVRRHDPEIALSPGEDALLAYRAIIPQAYERLTESGALAVEVGAGQARLVQALMEKAGFSSIAVRNDLSGIGRVVIATK